MANSRYGNNLYLDRKLELHDPTRFQDVTWRAVGRAVFVGIQTRLQ
jgi:hypothetical protein